MIDRREMMKLVVIGVAGAAIAGSVPAGAMVESGALRFSIEGDMGVVQATANGESIRVDGSFAERARFALG